MPGRPLPSLELKVPPLLVTAICAAAMVGVALALPGAALAVPGRVGMAAALALVGGLVALAGVVTFRAHGTTMNPLAPAAASGLVTGGVYRLSRNPMYLGFLLALAGLAVYLANLAALPLLPAFVLYLNRFQIEPEERLLLTRFGDDYAAYMDRVRRWL
jgi:protein-S-isoprenylcysteine O-methyltransferase Ste14